jgi:hypothetical protein
MSYVHLVSGQSAHIVPLSVCEASGEGVVNRMIPTIKTVSKDTSAVCNSHQFV